MFLNKCFLVFSILDLWLLVIGWLLIKWILCFNKLYLCCCIIVLVLLVLEIIILGLVGIFISLLRYLFVIVIGVV